MYSATVISSHGGTCLPLVQIPITMPENQLDMDI